MTWFRSHPNDVKNLSWNAVSHPFQVPSKLETQYDVKNHSRDMVTTVLETHFAAKNHTWSGGSCTSPASTKPKTQYAYGASRTEAHATALDDNRHSSG